MSDEDEDEGMGVLIGYKLPTKKPPKDDWSPAESLLAEAQDGAGAHLEQDAEFSPQSGSYNASRQRLPASRAGFMARKCPVPGTDQFGN